jgi:hypothetical protein
MKTILSTTDRSLVESLRLSLEAEGIQAVVQNDASSPLPMIPVNVLVQEADYERGYSIARALEEGSA